MTRPQPATREIEWLNPAMPDSGYTRPRDLRWIATPYRTRMNVEPGRRAVLLVGGESRLDGCLRYQERQIVGNTVTVRCEHCAKPVYKPLKEYNRSVKRGRKFYCNNTCSAKQMNNGRKAKSVEMTCKHCGGQFSTTTKVKAAKEYCSRSCASAGSYSVTLYRQEKARESGIRNKGNLLSMGELLKRREAWRYVELHAAMKDVPHEFEYTFGGFVYDLFLPDEGVLIEFDDPYHNSPSQRRTDRVKDLVAKLFGYKVCRIKVQAATVISASVLDYACQHAA